MLIRNPARGSCEIGEQELPGWSEVTLSHRARCRQRPGRSGATHSWPPTKAPVITPATLLRAPRALDGVPHPSSGSQTPPRRMHAPASAAKAEVGQASAIEPLALDVLVYHDHRGASRRVSAASVGRLVACGGSADVSAWGLDHLRHPKPFRSISLGLTAVESLFR
jgi:hypothetical protein